MPRNPKMTVKRQRAIIEMLYAGHTISGACEAIGVSRTTELRFRKENPDYRRQVEAALDARVEVLEDALYAAALSGVFAAQRFWLLNRARHRWKHETHHVLSGEDGGPIKFQISEIVVAPLDQPEYDDLLE